MCDWKFVVFLYLVSFLLDYFYVDLDMLLVSSMSVYGHLQFRESPVVTILVTIVDHNSEKSAESHRE